MLSSSVLRSTSLFYLRLGLCLFSFVKEGKSFILRFELTSFYPELLFFSLSCEFIHNYFFAVNHTYLYESFFSSAACCEPFDSCFTNKLAQKTHQKASYIFLTFKILLKKLLCMTVTICTKSSFSYLFLFSRLDIKLDLNC